MNLSIYFNSINPEDRGYITPCLIWTGAIHNKEFAQYGIYNSIRIHRWIYEHVNGPIPEGLEVDHLCEQKQCVNPTHLEAVTKSENLRRRHHNHKLRRGL